MERTHQYVEAPDVDLEAPLNACQALAHALAEARESSRGPTCDDLADAAFLLVDLRAVGWDVQTGRHGTPGASCAAALCALLPKVRNAALTPVMQVQVERAVGGLWALGFDMLQVGATK